MALSRDHMEEEYSQNLLGVSNVEQTPSQSYQAAHDHLSMSLQARQTSYDSR